MNTLEKLTWQKKAGIISETQYREALTNLLEKKKKTEEEPEEEPVAGETDSEEMPEEGGDLESEAPVEEPMEPTTGGSAQDVQKELMDALEAAKGIGDVKLQRQISNALTYFTRQQVASSETEASSANAPL